MLLTVNELRDRVSTELAVLVDQLADLTGRGGDSERRAWQRSLPRLIDALTSAALDRVHVHFAKREHHVALEYQIPGASSWCDVVLLGRHQHRPSAVVIELKDWDTSGDRPGLAEGLIERRGSQELHPSDQVRGYVEYCRYFHSAVLEGNANVHGFVLFTAAMLKHAYALPPNAHLAANYPLFSLAQADTSEALPAFLGTRLTEQDASFATAFAMGTFRQDRGFLRQIGGAIQGSKERHFELLDNQRRAFHLCMAKAREAVAELDKAKKVVIVEGPPGSGKSAVAAKLWAELITDANTPDGNVVLVTTSQSQSSAWTYLLDQLTPERAGRGIARKASSFSPLSLPELNQLRNEAGRRDLYKDAAKWREHLADLSKRSRRLRPGAEGDSCLVALVDEAHALINPEREHGVGQYGFATGLGPQAYHIIRCSRLTVFFVDPDQSFRARENTSIDDLFGWAKNLGASVDRVSLHGVQFRCAGSAEYVAWVDSLLGGASDELNAVYASAWHSDSSTTQVRAAGNVIAFPRGATTRSAHLVAAQGAGSYFVQSVPKNSDLDFRVFDNPFEMESKLRSLADHFTVRLVSSYSRPWKTADSAFPHELPPESLDFCEPVELVDGARRVWSRPWNFVPGGDYTGFVMGRPGLRIHDDPLCEVGCTYAVRGFDFDYLGVLWLDDLVWRTGRWVAPLDKVHESGISLLVRQARREGPVAPAGPKGVSVMEKLRQAYRIVLTRAIRGVYVWIPDVETREHVRRSLSR